MIGHDDTVFILSNVTSEPDRLKKKVGLRLLALLRRDSAAEPCADGMVRSIAHDFGGSAAEHAHGLLKAAGLA